MTSRALRTMLTCALPLLSALPACKSDSSTGPDDRSVVVANLKVGDLLSINVNGNDPCTNAVLHAARVVAIGTHSIVFSDTLNPSGGFTTADFQRFAARFDTLVYPLDVANFGEPSDIDKNARVNIVFTRAVNELTPAGSSQYVGGFAFSRDLFPIVATNRAQACAASNQGEYFYALAPDPTGTVNFNVRTKNFVDSVTTAVLAHEFQHIINSSQHLYVSNATAFESKWLDEGLAHEAEELLYYRESGYAPRSNLGITQLRASSRVLTAYNSDMSGNASRYRLFLQSPSTSSPYRTDDSLATRGAAWSFLRYSLDRLNATDSFTAGDFQLLSGSGDLVLAAGTAAAEYSLTLTNTQLASDVSAPYTLRGAGVVPPSGAVIGFDGPLRSASVVQEPAPALQRDGAWEARHRAIERSELTPRIATARAWYAAQGMTSRAPSYSYSAAAGTFAETDAAVLQRLVSAKDTGFTNFNAVVGGNMATFVRDWNVSHAVDDVAQLNTNLQQRSWNWHSIFPALGSGGGSYPLAIATLGNNVTVSGSVVSGGASFFRVAVPANATATLTLAATGTANANLRLVAVRTK